MSSIENRITRAASAGSAGGRLHSRRRRVIGWMVVGAVAGTAAFGGTSVAAASTPAASSGHHDAHQRLAPKITHTRTGPTGYEVTFRFSAPDATAVAIRGEWGLRSEADATTRPPSEYQPGDFFNEALVTDMTRGKGGVWTFTTPLPPGTWSYQFQVTPAADPDQLYIQDPANPTFNQRGTKTQGSYEPLSQVYVPTDKRFSPDDRSVQAPVPGRQQGKIVSLRYSSPGATTCATDALCASPADKHDITVYTPAGYNPNRKLPYPTLYLSHGGGGNEIDWPTQGASAAIIDRLIAEKTLQPTVVVTTDFNGLPVVGGSAERGYSLDLIDNVIPFVEKKYNVSDESDDRAFGGLSAGGGRAGDLLFNFPTTFGYYGIWSSTGAFGPTIDFSNPDARTRLALNVGIGTQDPGVLRHEGLDRLAATDIPFTRNDVNGVHSWDVWRQLMANFAEKIAFAHTETAVDVSRKAVTATVDASSTLAAPVTGTVQFSLDGKKIGKPVKLHRGTATLPLTGRNAPSGSLAGVVATYSGDRYYATSTSE